MAVSKCANHGKRVTSLISAAPYVHVTHLIHVHAVHVHVCLGAARLVLPTVGGRMHVLVIRRTERQVLKIAQESSHLLCSLAAILLHNKTSLRLSDFSTQLCVLIIGSGTFLHYYIQLFQG